jgi:hypothetical protein
MLYRLDFLNDDGSTAEAVHDIIVCADFLSRHASTARKKAIQAAANSGRAVVMTRIGRAGLMRPTLVIFPDGKCSPPAGMDSGHNAEARVCFCRNCRAGRAR